MRVFIAVLLLTLSGLGQAAIKTEERGEGRGSTRAPEKKHIEGKEQRTRISYPCAKSKNKKKKETDFYKES